MLDPRLVRLRAELERLGSVVVPHGEHICVRLTLAASVVVRVDSGVLRCRAQLGPFGRSSTLGGTALATTAGVALLSTGGLALPIVAAVAGVSAMLVELGGFVAAESCITRIHVLWSRIVDGDTARIARPYGDDRALHPPLPDELTRPAPAGELHAERRS
ncbi:MAG TPA: hypothetical protein VJ812_10575 [Gemmatimonadaceae bacterium]|jgi:hypothetical protein|nr:hypothetical protein [Gemmatimonadaceae bacterium]